MSTADEQVKALLHPDFPLYPGYDPKTDEFVLGLGWDSTELRVKTLDDLAKYAPVLVQLEKIGDAVCDARLPSGLCVSDEKVIKAQTALFKAIIVAYGPQAEA